MHTLSGSQTEETTLVWKLLVRGKLASGSERNVVMGLWEDAYMRVSSMNVYTNVLCVCIWLALC